MTIRIGTSRLVILTKRFAFKLPCILGWRRFLCGLLANIHECEWDGYSELLCPIVFSLPGGWIVVMKRASELVSLEDVDLNLFAGLPLDIKPSNFGLLDGKVVLIDYGS